MGLVIGEGMAIGAARGDAGEGRKPRAAYLESHMFVAVGARNVRRLGKGRAGRMGVLQKGLRRCAGRSRTLSSLALMSSPLATRRATTAGWPCNAA
jgi:hypothetical protein